MSQDKIKLLTDSLYREGVEKGQAEAKQVIEKATQKAEAIVEEARQKAESMLEEAREKSRQVKSQIETEIRIVSREIIHDFHHRIADLIEKEVIDKQINRDLNDPEMVSRLVLALLQNWDSQGNQVPVEVLLPESQRKDFEKWFEDKVFETLNRKPRFGFSERMRGGFQIKPEGASYKVDFSEEGFIELFRQYLKPRTRKILFPGGSSDMPDSPTAPNQSETV